MPLTKDQKQALYVGGGLIAIAGLFYLLNSSGNTAVPPTAVSLPDATATPVSPSYTGGYNVGGLSAPPNINGPTYMDYNVGPLNPPPSLVPPIGPNQSNACCGVNDGCFTSSPLDTGRGPVTLTQLVNGYATDHPEFQQYVQQVQTPYNVTPATIAEMANTRTVQNYMGAI